MLIVIALGGNALLQRSQPLEANLQLENIKIAAQSIAALAKNHQVVICHGNGPQVGLLALQSEAYTKVTPYPLDQLDAETQGLIGYLIQQQLKNKLPEKEVVTLLTQIEVDPNDTAFSNPSKPIGPVYNKQQAEELAKTRGWDIAEDGKYFRRVVPSPKPKSIVELNSIKALLKAGDIVICGGGGGIPISYKSDGEIFGIEAVIDKDNTAALIAKELNADKFIILTDVSAACLNWGTPEEMAIKKASPQLLEQFGFAKGSMGPKVSAAANFANNTGRSAAIGKLSELAEIIELKSGTHVESNATEVEYY